MVIENIASIDFDPRSSIVDRVFDCRLPGVFTGLPRFGYEMLGEWYFSIDMDINIHPNQAA